jgi:hypothetical protein
MGAVSFINTIEATSVNEGFEKLVEEALHELGHSRYNGTISTCDNCCCVKTFSKYSPKTEKKMLEFIEQRLDRMYKRDVECIDLGVIGYDRITIKKIHSKPTAKFEQKYAIIDCDTGNLIASRKTKKEACDFAYQCIVKGKDVEIRKMPVLISGSSLCTSFEKTTKRFKTMPDATKYIVNPMHKYIFYGFAAE